MPSLVGSEMCIRDRYKFPCTTLLCCILFNGYVVANVRVPMSDLLDQPASDRIYTPCHSLDCANNHPFVHKRWSCDYRPNRHPPKYGVCLEPLIADVRCM